MRPFNSAQFSSVCRWLLALAVLIVPLVALAQPPVEGDSSSTNQAGVTGKNNAPAGGNGIGVSGTSVNGEGVHGDTNSTSFAAVAGIEFNPNSPVTAVFGQHMGNGPGVFGTSAGGNGVFGESQGQGEGVHGQTSSSAAAAVAGIMLNPNGTGAGVFGQHKGNGPGVFGTSAAGNGLFGESLGQGEGVHGQTSSSSAAGVAGIILNPNGTGAGVYGESRGLGPAGFFKGNVVVTDGLLVQGTTFQSLLQRIQQLEQAQGHPPGCSCSWQCKTRGSVGTNCDEAGGSGPEPTLTECQKTALADCTSRNVLVCGGSLKCQ